MFLTNYHTFDSLNYQKKEDYVLFERILRLLRFISILNAHLFGKRPVDWESVKKRISIHFYRKYQKKLILIEFSTSRNKWFQNMISKLLVFMKWKRRVFSKPFLGIKLSINFNNSRNNQFVLFWFFKLCLNCYKVRINVVFLYQLYCLELYVFWLCSIEQLLGIEKKCKKTRF